MFQKLIFKISLVMISAFFLISTASAQETVVNVVEWTTVSGGNGHSYGIIPLEMPWSEHQSFALTQTLDGKFGYLATITSAEENQFIVDNILSSMPNPPTINSQFYLGGQEFNNGEWMWHTGEAFAYTNWNWGEPNNVGIDAAIGIWGAAYPNVGTWNDSPSDTIGHGSIHQLYSIIEFGGFSPSADTLINFVQWTSAMGGNDHWYAVLAVEHFWEDADLLAKTFVHNSIAGHLATVTSQNENDFILNNVILDIPEGNIGIVNESWLGGIDATGDGGFDWITDEPFLYSNWSSGEPNNPGLISAIGMKGNNNSNPGEWNNSLTNDTFHDLHQYWSIVEFDEVIVEPGHGSLSLDHVVGSPSAGKLYAETDISFKIRVENNTGISVDGIFNSFAVSSPDGATWAQTTGDTIGTIGKSLFDLVYAINYFSADGVGADTIAFGGASISHPGLVDGFNEVSYEINIGPIGIADVGKTICIDSSFSTPSGTWKWSTFSGNFIPSWDGPHCYTIVAPSVADDTLINLVQWTTAEGGNDHWYGIISLVQNWDNHNATAASLDVDGETGYLLSVTSAEENQFVVDNILAGNTNQPSVADEFYIGGWYFTEGLTWLWTNSSLPFTYTNWQPGEPSGDGFALAMWGASSGSAGMWNDVPRNVANDTYNRLWAIVEFGVDPPVDAEEVLIVNSIAAGYGENVQTVSVDLSQPIKGATIPLAIPSGVEVLDISTNGFITDSWDFNITQIKPDSGFIFVVLANSHGSTIPAGLTDIFSISFTNNNGDCNSALTAHWDTTLSDDISRRLAFADINAATIPVAFDMYRDSVLIPPMVAGDFSNDGIVDIGDLVSLVDNMYWGGVDPQNMNVLDVNGDCAGPDIGDLVRLIDYMFLSNLPLPCGCMSENQKLDVESSYDISLFVSYENDRSVISISSSIDLKGIELFVKNRYGTPEKLYAEELELLSHSDNGIMRLGIIDLKGQNSILSGESQLLIFDGEVEIISAVVAGDDGKSLIPTIHNKLSLLPDAYSLFQNYPNPFNPSTQISYWLPEASSVKLSIYNISGQRVATIVDSYQEAGEYTVEWNGSQQSSGIYLYKLESNNFSSTRKMVLLK